MISVGQPRSLVNFNYLFFAFFAFAVGSTIYKIVRNRGFRGALFGAPVRSTVAEMALEPRGMVKTRLKLHELAGPTNGVKVGLEIIHSTVGSWQTVPVALSANEARQLAEMLAQAARRSESSVAAG
jgi:hypothetical protein